MSLTYMKWDLCIWPIYMTYVHDLCIWHALTSSLLAVASISAVASAILLSHSLRKYEISHSLSIHEKQTLQWALHVWTETYIYDLCIWHALTSSLLAAASISALASTILLSHSLYKYEKDTLNVSYMHDKRPTYDLCMWFTNMTHTHL